MIKTDAVAKITIKEVCDKAESNRGTLYTHYQDCYYLLEKIVNEGLCEFGKMLASIEATGAQAALEAILSTLRSNDQLIRALNGSTVGPRFICHLAGCCFCHMEQWLGPETQTGGSVKRDAGFAFLAGGSRSVIE